MPSVLVTVAGRLLRGPDDYVYSPDPSLARPFWSRYLGAFDDVGVACRIARCDTIPASFPRADGDGVVFHDLPAFVGPWQYLVARGKVVRRLREILDQYEAYCLRVPCWIGTLACQELRRRGRPFGVEVVGDPWDSLARGAVRSVIRPYARRAARRTLQLQCQNACAAAYVTRKALQRRYPARAGVLSVGCSDVQLDNESYVPRPRVAFPNGRQLVFVGTLEVLYKGQDVLIRALARCARDDVRLTMIGDGRCRTELEALAASLSLTPRVTFTGNLAAGQQVRDLLDRADLFVLPSRQEGLPRAMLEAMARGLPCIGSTVGGIPELLPAEDLVEPGDTEALARKIADFLGNEARLASSSARNLRTAREYQADILAARRRDFYLQIRRCSRMASPEVAGTCV